MTVRKLKPAIAYTRVSTSGQGDNGIGLSAQSEAIYLYANRKGYEIIDAYEDTASGRDLHGWERRDGFYKAVQASMKRGATLLANDMDRIARSMKTTEDLIKVRKIKMVTVKQGKITAADIETYGRSAEVVGEKISRTTKESLTIKKQEGIKFGNPTNLGEAQKKGAQANHHRFQQKSKEIAKELSTLPGWQGMTAKRIANELNARGVLSGGGRPWTASGLRRPLKEARKLLGDIDAPGGALKAPGEDPDDSSWGSW